MIPVYFEGCNMELKKPGNMPDEHCASMPVYKDVDDDGYIFYLSAWQPNKEDIEAINKGMPIYLKVLGSTPPPIALYTMDENDNCNSPR